MIVDLEFFPDSSMNSPLLLVTNTLFNDYKNNLMKRSPVDSQRRMLARFTALLDSIITVENLKGISMHLPEENNGIDRLLELSDAVDVYEQLDVVARLCQAIKMTGSAIEIKFEYWMPLTDRQRYSIRKLKRLNNIRIIEEGNTLGDFMDMGLVPEYSQPERKLPFKDKFKKFKKNKK